MRFFRQKTRSPEPVPAPSVTGRRVEITVEREICVVMHQPHPPHTGTSCPACGQLLPSPGSKDLPKFIDED